MRIEINTKPILIGKTIEFSRGLCTTRIYLFGIMSFLYIFYARRIVIKTKPYIVTVVFRKENWFEKRVWSRSFY